MTSTEASASSCFWPPESRCAGWSAWPARPYGASARSTRSRDLLLVEPAPAQPERDVLGHGRHHDLRVRVGEAEADPAAHLACRACGCRGRRRAPCRRVGSDQPVEHPRERRLARAVGADHADPLLVEPHVDVAHARCAVAVAVGDARRTRSAARLDHHRDALPAADGDRGQPVATAGRARTSWLKRRTTRTAPRRAPRVPQRQGARPRGRPVRGRGRARAQQASTCPAKASLSSTTSRSSSRRPARSRAARTAGTMPSPGRFGSTPAVAVARIRRPGRPAVARVRRQPRRPRR